MTEQRDVHSWLMRLLSFEVNVCMSLTEEKRRSAEEEKKIFLDEIGVSEDFSKDVYTDMIAFFIRNAFASTDEGRQSIQEDIHNFLKGVEYYKAASDKHVREKSKTLLPLPPDTIFGKMFLPFRAGGLFPQMASVLARKDGFGFHWTKNVSLFWPRKSARQSPPFKTQRLSPSPAC